MTKYCDACHAPNRDRARYCRGCAGRFSGVRFDAAAFVQTLPEAPSARRPASTRAAGRPARTPTSEAKPQGRGRFGRLPRIDISVLLLMIVLPVLAGTFV